MARILQFRAVRARRPGAADRAPADARPSRRAAQADGPPPSAADAQRFRDIVLPHLDAAYRLARYLTRDPAQAEDVVQEAFLKGFRGFAGFRGGDPRAWLFAIVRNEFLSAVRRRAPWADNGVADETPDGHDTPEAALVRSGEVAAVRRAIEALPAPFRETLVLRELEEMSYRQIAEITGAPIGTVMSRLARGRELLLTALREEEEP